MTWATVIKHHVYHRARAGSLEIDQNVWFGIKYTDGSTTGQGGAVEAPTPLLETAEGRAALLRYVKTKKGQSAAKYVPSELRA